MKPFKITVPIPAVSDRIFDSQVHPRPLPDVPSAPELADANHEMAKMVKSVKNESVYGPKGDD